MSSLIGRTGKKSGRFGFDRTDRVTEPARPCYGGVTERWFLYDVIGI